MEERIPLFEDAVALDPEFALALAKLAAIHRNLGNEKALFMYAERAFASRHRATLRERYSIEAKYYNLHEETVGRAIEVYRKLLDRFPDDSARWNFGIVLHNIERTEDAIAELENLRRRGMINAGTLSLSYAELGDYEKGLEVQREAIAQLPDAWNNYRNLGLYLTLGGRYDEALEAWDKFEAHMTWRPYVSYGRWEVYALREEWTAAKAAAEQILRSEAPFWRWRGWRTIAWNELYGGYSERSLDALERSRDSYNDPTRYRGYARAQAAHVHLARGEEEQAIAETKIGRHEGRGEPAEWQSIFYEGIALARLGRFEEAQAMAEHLQKRTESIPSEKEKRRTQHLLGEIALARGDAKSAVENLEAAQLMLAPRGLLWERGPLNHHVPIWYSLATAYLALGDSERAELWFHKIVESEYEHLYWPIFYVRSMYSLASLHRERGDSEEARKLYGKFLEYWREGDLDRDRVEEAIRYTS